MELSNLYGLITLAFGLGILHALDADHIMAVSALTSSSQRPRDTIRFCLRWAVGHGITLIIIGSCVYLLGMAIPDQLSIYAEHLVGGLLIAIGVYILVKLRQNQVHVHYHEHDGLPKHAHWHSHQPSKSLDKKNIPHEKIPHRHRHSAVLVGVLHGAAGSAPLLVLIPVAQLNTPIYGVIYLVIFSISVLACMAVFGGMLGFIYEWFSARGQRVFNLIKVAIASSTIVVGGLLLVGV